MLKSWILMLLCIILFINPSTPCGTATSYDNDYKNDRTLPRLPCSTVCSDISSGFEGTVAYSPEDRQVDEGNTEVTATFTCTDASDVLEVSSLTCKNDGTGELTWNGLAPQCLPVCKDISTDFADGTVAYSFNDRRIGTTVMFTCSDTKKVPEVKSLSCGYVGGGVAWSGSAPSCVVDCPGEFKALKGFCYIFNLTETAYASHKTACTAAGGYMAKIDNVQEQNIIQDHLSTLNFFGMLIGLENMSGDNINYRWIKDNMVPTYTKWKTDEPLKNGAKCVAVGGPTTPAPGYWSVIFCSWPVAGICEADPSDPG